MNYTFEVIIKNQKINCRAFTLREYKDLLQAKLQGTLEDFIPSLIETCTDAKNLNKQASELLLINLWAHSLGEVNIEREWVCSCGREQTIPMTLTRAQLSKEPEVIKDFGTFKVVFRYPSLFEDKNNAMMVAGCIDYILTTTGEKLTLEDLSDTEIDDLYSVITAEDILSISSALTEPKPFLAIPISCECGDNSVHIIKGLKEFFKVM
jgi:hypothetical protein